ncbi:V8-like Glu-specific endopeptidase [Devosia sp. UYZn731]|uniref:trypsin-like serine protease n=1 Tax=Devosia sp. UYZn731 TaxID=3156345 RepID=UPI003393AD36
MARRIAVFLLLIATMTTSAAIPASAQGQFTAPDVGFACATAPVASITGTLRDFGSRPPVALGLFDVENYVEPERRLWELLEPGSTAMPRVLNRQELDYNFIPIDPSRAVIDDIMRTRPQAGGAWAGAFNLRGLDDFGDQSPPTVFDTGERPAAPLPSMTAVPESGIFPRLVRPELAAPRPWTDFQRGLPLKVWAEPIEIDCEQLSALGRRYLPGRDEDVQMTGGTEPDPGQAPALQAQLVASLGTAAGGGVLRMDAASAAAPKEPANRDCHSLTWESLDSCFLPSIGLVSPTAEGDVTCSGTVVGPYHVLTAAHCVCVPGKNRVMNPSGVLLGTHGGFSRAFYLDSPLHGAKVRIADLSEGSDKSSVVVAVESVEVYEGYCLNRLQSHDLALIKVPFDTPFPPALWARFASHPKAGARINIAGFGRDLRDEREHTSNSAAAPELRNVKRYLSATFTGIAGDMLQVKGDVGDSCQGDSGSGAYVRLADGTLAVFGVLSRGDRECSNVAAATYVEIANERYASFLHEIYPVLDLTSSNLQASDSDLCIGDDCAGGIWDR